MLLRELIELERAKPLSADTVMKMSYRSGLVYLYYDAIGKKTLKQLLPKEGSGVLILFVDHKTSRKIGHFCLLFRHKGIHFFDPLGLGLAVVTHRTGSRDKLLKLLKGHHAHINKHKFQRLDTDVNTCGRHCITRWNASHFTPKQYNQLMHYPGMQPDDIVVMMTLEKDISAIKPK